MTAAEIAKPMGTSVQAVYNWEKGKNNPTTENVGRLAELLRVDASELIKGNVVPIMGAPATAQRTPLPPSDVEFAPDAPPFERLVGPRDVPELGIAVGGEDGDFDLNGETIAYVPRPPALAGKDIFAIRVKNDSMEPRFYEGDLLYVERRREPRPGEDAVIELKQTEEAVGGRAFIKRLVSKGLGIIVVMQHNPEKEITFKRDHIKQVYRVVPWNEVVGG